METQKIPAKRLGKGSIEAEKNPNTTDEVGAVVLKCSNEIDHLQLRDFKRTQPTKVKVA